MTYTYIPGAAPAGQNGRATVRQSNIELLRIVAMMLVLIVHADFLALGALMPLRSRRFRSNRACACGYRALLLSASMSLS